MAKALFPKHSLGSGGHAGAEDLASENTDERRATCTAFSIVFRTSPVRYWRLLNTRKQAKAPSDGLASSITAWVRGNQMSPIHFTVAFGDVRDYSSID